MGRDEEDLTSVLVVNGPHYTKEDCRDHECIAAIIHKDDKILMMDHVKMNRWAVPVGKIKSGESKEYTLKQEMKEELDINIIKYEEIISFTRPYIVNGISVKVKYHIFDILEYIGKIKNLEPNKHKSLKFSSIDELKKLKRISTATKAFLRYRRDDVF